MKIFQLFFLIFFLPAVAMAQMNLVPNGDFEQMNQCPFGIGNIAQATGWLNFGNSPEYFNACASGINNVPNSGFGYQISHNGVGMAGLITYQIPNAPTGPNYREYIGAQLNAPMQINQKYYLSFFINC